MKKIIVLSVVLGLMCLFACQNDTNNSEPEKKTVMAAELAGTWVNDNTPDISFTLDLYSFKNVNKIKHGNKEYNFDVSLPSSHPYLYVTDLTGDTYWWDIHDCRVEERKTSDDHNMLGIKWSYSNNKMTLTHDRISPAAMDNYTEDFQQFLADYSGTYSKK